MPAPIVASGHACDPDWTSRDELELLFGASPIAQWADVENTNDPRYIAHKIDWGVKTATSDAKARLRGSNADGILTPGWMLRSMVTALGGVALYTARGVKDTSSDEGRFRLSWARKKADDWFNAVVAGRYELDEVPDPPTSFPFTIAPRTPYMSPFGRRLTPEEALVANQIHELQGVQNSGASVYSLWWDGFDSETPSGSWTVP